MPKGAFFSYIDVNKYIMTIEEAIMCVQEFIETGHKSMYLMDAWITIINYIQEVETRLKRKEKEKANGTI